MIISLLPLTVSILQIFPFPSMKLSGDILMQTTHRDTYKEIKGVHRPTPIVNESDLARHKPRGKFAGETQFKHDFPGYGGGQPMPPPAARPAPDTLDLKFDNL